MNYIIACYFNDILTIYPEMSRDETLELCNELQQKEEVYATCIPVCPKGVHSLNDMLKRFKKVGCWTVMDNRETRK